MNRTGSRKAGRLAKIEKQKGESQAIKSGKAANARLNKRMTPILTDIPESICCGATLDSFSRCTECHEMSGPVEYEDDTLTFTPTVAEIATVAFLVIAMFFLSWGLNTGGSIRDSRIANAAVEEAK